MQFQNIAHDLELKSRTDDVIIKENVTFESLLLSDNILKGLTACGFRKPSPIQLKAIPLGRCGFDLIVKSKSGTGKTLVFGIIALETVKTAKNHLQVLILVPTREIAVQIQDVLRIIGSSINGLQIECFIGGLPVEEDVKKAKLCHIAVGAPGRIKHLLKLGALSTEFVRLFVMDEADKLMELSFQSDINEIYNTLPQRKQIITSSATYPQELDIFLTNYMLSPSHVSSENETPVLLGLKQFVFVINCGPNAVQLMKAKNEALVNILSKVSFTQCLVFSNYQTRAESISNHLNQKGWNSSYISAAQSQVKRLEAVNNLKDFKSRILLSTDLTARGIDAPNVDLVINYDIPQEAVTYLHRMGRAGRYGAPGICVNLAVNGNELRQLQIILGSIGAANLSISKLPSLCEEMGDLWHTNSNSFEQIPGIISCNSSNKINEEIKNEIMSFKHKNHASTSNNNNNNKGNTKRKSEEGKLKLEELTDSVCVQNLLNQKEKEMEEVFHKMENFDTDELLGSLLNTSTVKEECEDDHKKRKRNSCNSETNQEKRINDTKHAIFCKNRALLNITKLLSNFQTAIDPDLVNSLEEYLHLLKSEDSVNLKGASVKDILINADDSVKQSPITECYNKMENIFKIGFESAISDVENAWLDAFSPEETDHFHQVCKEEVISSTSETLEEEEDDDCEMEEYSEGERLEGVPNQDVALQWVPVVQNNDIPTCNEHYTKCYEDCSNVLWQTGLSFETVDAFDTWYYDWQQQLQSVRNYVQQNIYVEEMSKYQQNRRPTNND